MSQVNTKTFFHEGSSAFNLLEVEQKSVLGNVVYASEVVKIGWWHRLLILKPDSILICKVVGIWSLLRTLFNREYEPREYAVIETVPLKKGLSVHSEDGLTWNLHNKHVTFRQREECSSILGSTARGHFGDMRRERQSHECFIVTHKFCFVKLSPLTPLFVVITFSWSSCPRCSPLSRLCRETRLDGSHGS